MSQELNNILIQHIKRKKILKSPHIIEAFTHVDRIHFVPEDLEGNAYLDVPILISPTATTSQPSTVAFMLEILEVQPGERILEVGTGSGYVTALLADIVGETGKVFSIEKSPGLKKLAEKNLKKYKYRNISLYVGDGKDGVPDGAPYDRIIAGAEVSEIPEAWKDQLVENGIIVTPLDGHVLKARKVSEDDFTQDAYPLFHFIKMK